MNAVLLAFDYGTRRIGIASGNLLTRTATPLTTLHIGKEFPWSQLDRIVADWGPAHLIVGQPNTVEPSEIDTRIRQFVQELEKRYKLPVATVDETLTSRSASSALAEDRRTGLRTKRVKKGEIDRQAACLIAQQWMNEAIKHG